jgi:hypothetical protein
MFFRHQIRAFAQWVTSRRARIGRGRPRRYGCRRDRHSGSASTRLHQGAVDPAGGLADVRSISAGISERLLGVTCR